MEKIACVAALLFSVASKSHCLEPLLEAIEHNQVENVKELLKRESSLTPEKKETLLHAVQASIEKYKRSEAFLLNSKKDLARVILGSLVTWFAATGCFSGLGSFLWQGFHLRLKERMSGAFFTILCGSLGALGIWQVMQGLNKVSAKSNLEKATQIENLIHQAVL